MKEIADCTWNERKEKHFESKTKSCLEERLLKWKEHFKNLHENPPEITDKSTKKLINGQVGVKFG